MIESLESLGRLPEALFPQLRGSPEWRRRIDPGLTGPGEIDRARDDFKKTFRSAWLLPE